MSCNLSGFNRVSLTPMKRTFPALFALAGLLTGILAPPASALWLCRMSGEVVAAPGAVVASSAPSAHDCCLPPSQHSPTGTDSIHPRSCCTLLPALPSLHAPALISASHPLTHIALPTTLPAGPRTAPARHTPSRGRLACFRGPPPNRFSPRAPPSFF